MTEDQATSPGEGTSAKGRTESSPAGPEAPSATTAEPIEPDSPAAASSAEDGEPGQAGSSGQPQPSQTDSESPVPAAPDYGETVDTPREETPISGRVVIKEEKDETGKGTDTEKQMDPAAEFEVALDAFEGAETGTAYDQAYQALTRGQLVSATVVQVDKDRVFVDLGTKAEGVIPIDELSSRRIESPSDVVQLGDRIKVVILNPKGGEGNPIVSKKRAAPDCVKQ